MLLSTRRTRQRTVVCIPNVWAAGARPFVVGGAQLQLCVELWLLWVLGEDGWRHSLRAAGASCIERCVERVGKEQCVGRQVAEEPNHLRRGVPHDGRRLRVSRHREFFKRRDLRRGTERPRSLRTLLPRKSPTLCLSLRPASSPRIWKGVDQARLALAPTGRRLSGSGTWVHRATKLVRSPHTFHLRTRTLRSHWGSSGSVAVITTPTRGEMARRHLRRHRSPPTAAKRMSS